MTPEQIEKMAAELSEELIKSHVCYWEKQLQMYADKNFSEDMKQFGLEKLGEWQEILKKKGAK